MSDPRPAREEVVEAALDARSVAARDLRRIDEDAERETPGEVFPQTIATVGRPEAFEP